MPKGFASTVYRNYKACESRMWLLDNSRSMSERDSHLIGGSLETIRKGDAVARWEDLVECVAFHAKMAARCWIPTKFFLLNDPGPGASRKFALCWKGKEDVKKEMDQVRRVITSVAPDHARCPLARQVRSAGQGMAREAPRLAAQGKHMVFVVSVSASLRDPRGLPSSPPHEQRIFLLLTLTALVITQSFL